MRKSIDFSEFIPDEDDEEIVCEQQQPEPKITYNDREEEAKRLRDEAFAAKEKLETLLKCNDGKLDYDELEKLHSTMIDSIIESMKLRRTS